MELKFGDVFLHVEELFSGYRTFHHRLWHRRRLQPTYMELLEYACLLSYWLSIDRSNLLTSRKTVDGLNYVGYQFFVVFMEGPIHKFQHLWSGNFLYDLWNKILKPRILNPRMCHFCSIQENHKPRKKAIYSIYLPSLRLFVLKVAIFCYFLEIPEQNKMSLWSKIMDGQMWRWIIECIACRVSIPVVFQLFVSA